MTKFEEWPVVASTPQRERILYTGQLQSEAGEEEG